MRSPLKHPAVHFFIAGAAIFAASRWLTPPSTVLGIDDPHIISINAKQVEDLRSKEERRRGAALSAAELDALVEATAVDEMLYREALARRFDTDDAVVERRLVQDMRFLSNESSAADTALLRQAQALGLQSGDPVIRRRLIQKMHFVLTRERDVGPPSDEELQTFFAEHRHEFDEAPRARMSHIFFSGPQAMTRAAGMLDELAPSQAEPEVLGDLGEPFLAGSSLPSSSERGLAKIFGSELAHTCMSLPIGRWSGPFPSPYGVHLVWIHERAAGDTQPFEQVRSRIQHRLEAERSAAHLRTGIAELRAQYRIEVERPTS